MSKMEFEKADNLEDSLVEILLGFEWAPKLAIALVEMWVVEMEMGWAIELDMRSDTGLVVV